MAVESNKITVDVVTASKITLSLPESSTYLNNGRYFDISQDNFVLQAEVTDSAGNGVQGVPVTLYAGYVNQGGTLNTSSVKAVMSGTTDSSGFVYFDVYNAPNAATYFGHNTGTLLGEYDPSTFFYAVAFPGESYSLTSNNVEVTLGVVFCFNTDSSMPSCEDSFTIVAGESFTVYAYITAGYESSVPIADGSPYSNISSANAMLYLFNGSGNVVANTAGTVSGGLVKFTLSASDTSGLSAADNYYFLAVV